MLGKAVGFGVGGFIGFALAAAVSWTATAQNQYPGQYPQGQTYGAQGGYPAQQGNPAQQGYTAQQPYPPQTGYPQQQGYPAGQNGYPPQAGGYAQQPGGAYPPQAGGYPPQQGQGGGSGANPQPDDRLDQMMAQERQDMGVQPTDQLHSGEMHAPTPNQIPGGQVITTKGLVSLMQQQQVRFLLFDVLGAPQTLPNAISAVPAFQPGSYQDQIQQQFGQFLAQATQQKMDTPMVFYCEGLNCWMSYNASLRAIHLGYKNVLWYRGGLEAWTYAGLPTQPNPAAQQQAQQPYPPQQQYQQQPYSQQPAQQAYPPQGYPSQPGQQAPYQQQPYQQAPYQQTGGYPPQSGPR
jgi:PQQ-dependent catabolism-associated CXXCW motif protein